MEPVCNGEILRNEGSPAHLAELTGREERPVILPDTLELSRSDGGANNKRLTNWTLTEDELKTVLGKALVGLKDGSYFVRGPTDTGSRCDAGMPFASVLIIDGDKQITEDGEIIDGCVHPSLAHEALTDLGIRHFIYTSHSHDPAIQFFKWRAVIPCVMLNAHELSAMANWVIEQLQGLGCRVHQVGEMSTWSQAWYFPRIRDQEAEFLTFNGFLEGLKPIGREKVEAVTAAFKAEKREELPGSSGRASEKDANTPIGRFNKAHDSLEAWHELLSRYGYEFHCSEWINNSEAMRLTPPHSTSGVAGVMVYRGQDDGELLVYSHNASFDLESKARDYFGLYQKLEHDDDFDAAFAAIRAKEKESPNPEPLEFTPSQIEPIEWAVDGFLAQRGITAIAATAGAGKTTSLVPLSATVAGLVKDSLLIVELRRKVVYVTEDSNQVKRLLHGLLKHVSGHSDEEFREWFIVVPAKRLGPEAMAKAITTYRERYSYEASEEFNRYVVEPLIVLDTSNATLDLDNENDNALVGRVIASIKEAVGKAGVWLVCHSSKACSREDIRDMSARGASAFSGDCNTTAFLIKEEKIENKRFLILGKTRFEPDFTEIEIESCANYEIVDTPWGTTQQIWYRWGIVRPLLKGDRLSDQRKEANAKEKEVEDNARMQRIVKVLWERQHGQMKDTNFSGLSQKDLVCRAGGKRERVIKMLSELVECGVVDLKEKGGAKLHFLNVEKAREMGYALGQEKSLFEAA